MRVAVCVSGQARDDGTWLEGLTSRLETHNPDYYFVLYDDPLARLLLSNVKYKDYRIIPQRQFREEFLERLFRVSKLSKSQREFRTKLLNTPDHKRNVSGLRDNPLRMFYAISECNKLVRGKYDIVLRARPDLRIFRPKRQLEFPKFGEKEIGVPSNCFGGNNIGLDKFYSSDKIFCGPQKFMDKVSNLWEDLVDVLCVWDKTYRQVIDIRWLEPEITLHWAIENFYEGKTIEISDWNIDRYRIRR